MTRVTPLPRELAKLASSLAAPRSSQLLANSGSRAIAAKLHVRKELEHYPHAAQVPASERTMTTTHRPLTSPLPSPHRTIPLMQAFHNSSAPRARADTSTIDFAFLPDLSEPSPSTLSSIALRYPLLPDNFADAASRAPTLFAPEVVDAPLAQPQILVLDPQADVVSALSEVEGMGPDGVELRFGMAEEGGEGEGQYAGGMLTDMWKGLVDDVLGAAGKGGKVAM